MDIKFLYLYFPTEQVHGDEKMAHFNFENIVTDATRLDAPIQRGPLMRWQRKAMETGVRNLSVSDCKFIVTWSIYTKRTRIFSLMFTIA